MGRRESQETSFLFYYTAMDELWCSLATRRIARHDKVVSRDGGKEMRLFELPGSRCVMLMKCDAFRYEKRGNARSIPGAESSLLRCCNRCNAKPPG